MICPKCGNPTTCNTCGYQRPRGQDGREAVIAYEKAMEAYVLIADGRTSDAVLMMRGFLALPSTNYERENDGN